MKLFNEINTSSEQIERAELVLDREAIAKIAKENQVQQLAVATTLDICNAIVSRMNHVLLVADVRNINSKFFTNLRQANSTDFLRQINALLRKKLNLSDIAPMLRITEKGKGADDKYIQPYALDKVINLLSCMGANDRRGLNGYTKAILINLLEHGELSNDELKACVSVDGLRDLQRKQGKNAKAIRALYDSSFSGTAGTQCSSSKMSLRALQICNVEKRTGKTITFNETADNTKVILEILRMTENTEAERAKAAASIAAEEAEKKKKSA